MDCGCGSQRVSFPTRLRDRSHCSFLANNKSLPTCPTMATITLSNSLIVAMARSDLNEGWCRRFVKTTRLWAASVVGTTGREQRQPVRYPQPRAVERRAPCARRRASEPRPVVARSGLHCPAGPRRPSHGFADSI